MNVADVMTKDVLTVSPSTRLRDAARLFVERRISGVPVVDDDGTVVGVLSEGDILLKERDRSSSHSLLNEFFDVAGEDAKHDARETAQAMTTPAVTIRPNRSISEAATLMLDRCVNRLPVVDANRKLVGIVTRADLVRAFVREDDEIEREIRDDVVFRTLWISPERFYVDVDDGEVTIAGEVADADSARMLARFVERVPGVVGIRSRLTWPSA